MANILDYLDWRGDIPFSEAPFNAVDGLILSELGYAPLEEFVPHGFSIREYLWQICMRVQSATEAGKPLRYTFAQDEELIRKLSESRRFRNTQLTGFQRCADAEAALQFSAMTCILEDGTAFVAYRGTDGTVVGWKEDFNLCYMQQTGAQMYALQYLNTHFSCFPRPLRIGGHSKGGNLAVYASAFCKPEIRSRIMEVFSYDGPGFREEIVETEEYRQLLPRVRSFIPESSVIGLLLSSETEHTLVKCSVNGIMQHLSYNWEVQRNGFAEAETLSRSGAVINKTISGWLSEMNDEDRHLMVDAIFEVIGAPEKETFREINQSKRLSYTAMIKAVRKLSPEQQRVMLDSLKRIAASSKDAILTNEPHPKKENKPE